MTTVSVPRQLSLSVQLDDSATFENYYFSENSAANHVVNTLKNLSSGAFIYLWGASGVGRSHLLQALCHWADRPYVYLPLAEFTDQSPSDIFDDLEQMSLVILDDIDLVAHRQDWSEGLFHLYNRIQDAGGQLVISAGDSPAAIDTCLADLKSRLTAMQVFRLESLTDEEKTAALMFRANNRGINMPEAVCTYLLTHYSRDMAQQLSFLSKLDKRSLEEKRKLSVPFIKMILDTESH